jgi:hypothetical protein
MSSVDSSAVEDVPRRRKRKWSDDADVLLIREAKARKPHAQRYGAVGQSFDTIADSLNEGGRMPWETDRKHAQDRLMYLIQARRRERRLSAASTGADDEACGERELLLDDIIEECDHHKAKEYERKSLAKQRDTSLTEGGNQVRRLAMERQRPQETRNQLEPSNPESD